MGKKRIVYDFDDTIKPNHVIIDQHRHHHHHHHDHQKSKKIKTEAKLLHTLNAHFKKLAKLRSRSTNSLSSPSVASTATVAANTNTSCMAMHGGTSSTRHDPWHKDHHDHDHNDYDDVDGHDRDGGDMGVFEFGQECWGKTVSFIGLENNEDLFGGDCVLAPDFNASHNLVVVLEDGSGYGSYIPDPVMNLDSGDEGKYLYDILELSSQEDMINEFLKVNLFVS